ncbi:hypothetical protein PanWU01x14_110980 [Parasponia andersonii]|uniref:Uncharacterized protein n=1 Tax=Parasponia andersonii TaxID=3476 RepID=A0A2P5CYV8_PARAD|nr:hypothetical protein PanWU01x14_110980 [Parasponia andersonii]
MRNLHQICDNIMRHDTGKRTRMTVALHHLLHGMDDPVGKRGIAKTRIYYRRKQGREQQRPKLRWIQMLELEAYVSLGFGDGSVIFHTWEGGSLACVY